MSFLKSAYILIVFSNSMVPALTKCLSWPNARLLPSVSVIKIYKLIFFMALFSRYPSHFVKIVADGKHHIPANGAVSILRNKISACAAAKAHILVQQIVYRQGQLQGV